MSNYGFVAPKKVSEQWIAVWGGRESAQRVATENPHVRWDEKPGPQVRHFAVLLDLRSHSIHPLTQEGHHDLGLPLSLAKGYRQVFPGHRFLVKCHWRFQLEAFQGACQNGKPAIKIFQWSFGLCRGESPLAAMADLEWAPLYADGVLLGMYGSGYLQRATPEAALRIPRPLVMEDGRRCYGTEAALMQFRARAFRFRQNNLGWLGFTPREMEIIELLLPGQESCQAIARLLHRSPETIRTHFKNILQKGRKQWRFPFRDTRALVGFMREQALVLPYS